MGERGQGGPVRLAILMVSILGLVGVAVKTTGGSGGAVAHVEPNPGKVMAVITRRTIPADVRTKLAAWSHVPSGASAIDVGGATYVVGGFNRGGKPVGSVLRRVGIGGPYTRVAKLPVPVTGAALAHVGDRVYAIGGSLKGGKPSDKIEEYDIATEHSVIAGTLPHPLTQASALNLGGFVYIIGGVVGDTPSRAILRFDPFRETVALAGRLQLPAAGGRGVTSRAGVGYVVGARGSGIGPVNFAVTVQGPRGVKP
jgi:hypothetical protein